MAKVQANDSVKEVALALEAAAPAATEAEQAPEGVLIRSPHGLMIDPYAGIRFEGEVRVFGITNWMLAQIEAGKLVIVDEAIQAG